MKKLAFALLLFALCGCKATDEEIRADIAGKAMEDLNFAGLQYTVQNGVVNISGKCPSKKTLAMVKQTISNINVIKAANYNITITPVTLDTLTQAKLKIDSVLGQYPRVTAILSPQGVVLKGAVIAQKKEKLLKELSKQQNGFVQDSMTVY